ncbi:hypothetical protein AK812_SmicGene28046 [Symbiodinium microadriaticum]|uniref:Uncharacterized protein n=1 Tax=Symbiodinium microadriaticum TaxID=2951 RepID=A0A1Q9D5E0_SYMMI|nr:hypothetical protein AK812_SmicGene28046 [Symbiodinium microadriaticum]
MSVLTLLKMSNTSKWYLHYDELPDDASSWSSAFDPPTDLPTIKKDKPAKSTKRLKGSKKKAKRKKAKKSKKKSKTSARSLATESEAASETHSSTTMGDPMMFHRPINFRSDSQCKENIPLGERKGMRQHFFLPAREARCPNRTPTPAALPNELALQQVLQGLQQQLHSLQQQQLLQQLHSQTQNQQQLQRQQQIQQLQLRQEQQQQQLLAAVSSAGSSNQLPGYTANNPPMAVPNIDAYVQLLFGRRCCFSGNFWNELCDARRSPPLPPSSRSAPWWASLIALEVVSLIAHGGLHFYPMQDLPLPLTARELQWVAHKVWVLSSPTGRPSDEAR